MELKCQMSPSPNFLGLRGGTVECFQLRNEGSKKVYVKVFPLQTLFWFPGFLEQPLSVETLHISSTCVCVCNAEFREIVRNRLKSYILPGNQRKNSDSFEKHMYWVS